MPSKLMNAGDDLCGHWKGCPAVVNNVFSGSQVEEVISTLKITCRMEGNCSDCAGYHGVIMNLVSLHISAKPNSEVFCKINFMP